MFLIPFLFSQSVVVQPRVVNFKERQRFIPQGDMQYYVRGRMDGETSTMMGFVISWAEVIYSSSDDSSRGTVYVKITDLLNIPSYMSIPRLRDGHSSLSKESGYKRTFSCDSLNIFEPCRLVEARLSWHAMQCRCLQDARRQIWRARRPLDLAILQRSAAVPRREVLQSSSLLQFEEMIL